MKNNPIVLKYILLLSFILSIVFLFRVYYDIKHYNHMLDMQKNILTEDMHSIFDNSEDNLIDKYQLLNTHFINSNKIANYFRHNKREELYRLLEKDYKDIQKMDSNFFVMHFMDKNNITVLRMHKPQSYNDNLTKKRPIVSYANKTLKKQTGFEVGKNGIVYRITTPFIYNNEHLGVLEFGIKPKYFVEALSKKYTIDSLVLVKKEKLDILTVKKQYEEIEDYAIVSKNNFSKEFIDKIDLSQTTQVITFKKKEYLILNDLNLYDYKGDVVSKILIIKDITSFVSNSNNSLLYVNTLNLLVFMIIIFIIYVVFSKFSNEIEQNLKTITSLNKKSKDLHTKVNTDELTNIYNKRYFDNYIENFLQCGNKGSIIFLDIDHFKNINDTYGHQVGDKVLKSISKCLSENIRQNDLFARWGGEEFAIVLNNLDSEMAVKKAEQFRKCVEEYQFEQNLSVTISLGVTKIESTDTKNSLLQRVDSLLYQAKHNGRNRVAS